MSWASDIADRYRVQHGKSFKLKHFNPDDSGGVRSKAEARKLLQRGIDEMSELQVKLYAQDRWGLLLIFQAMDAAGKDSAIKHVMSGVNPQGCQVYSFKAPSNEELDHDYLWRTSRLLPERGKIGIFNRSYYEEVLVVRVHPEILKNEKLPPSLVDKHLWKDRYEDIQDFERYLTRNGIAIRKFFLNVSKEEQKTRFLERLRRPEKNWKFSAADVQERDFWDDYTGAYEAMIQHTAAKHAPWYVIPADYKWYTRVIVAAAIVDALDELKLEYPSLGAEKVKQLRAAAKALEGEGQKAPTSRRKSV